MNKTFLIKLIVVVVLVVLSICSLTSIFLSENSGAITINKDSAISKKIILPRDSYENKQDKRDNSINAEDKGQEDIDKDIDKSDISAMSPETNTDNEDGNVTIIIPNDDRFLVLINKKNAVTDSFVPQDLILPFNRASDRAESNQYMVREAAEAFNELSEAAAAEGHIIVVTTAYRSYNFQKILYDNYVAKDGQEAADRYSARPGTSEHQSGLAADVSSPSVNYKLTQEYGASPEGMWLADNCYKFGFIIRFPDGKEDITGYMYEPWHIRYVGRDVAEYIYNNQLTLEEYIEAIE